MNQARIVSDSIEVILFDLGGVLVELGPSPVPARALKPEQHFRLGDWFKSETATAFETGRIDADHFAARLIDELDLDCDMAELIEHFRAWPRQLYPGIPALLQYLRNRYRLAILTNTNALHWARFVDELDRQLQVEAVFASHQLGMAKPGAPVFEHVCAALDTAPRSILFVDDSPANVDAAAALGFRAELARGPAELERRLLASGVLPPGAPSFFPGG